VKTPLTAFKEDLQNGRFVPVGRWKEQFPAERLVGFEARIGDYMQELGYELSTDPAATSHSFGRARDRTIYAAYYECKQWAKVHTPLSRMMVDYSAILIDK
jgi:hypothetical protein